MARKIGSELISFAASCIFCSGISKVLAKTGLRENDPFASWNMVSFDTREVEGSDPESVGGSTGAAKLHKLVLSGFPRREDKFPPGESVDGLEEELPKREEKIPRDESLDGPVDEEPPKKQRDEEGGGAPPRVLPTGVPPKTGDGEVV